MPWKTIKRPVLRIPDRKEMMIILIALILSLLTIVYFAFRSGLIHISF